VALEDPHIVDDCTLIGTATLPDWIMGGKLTSRLWVQDKGKSILFLRPLRNDDVDTSDRRYELKDDTAKMQLVRQELTRLRHLASLHHPFVADEKENDIAKLSTVREKLHHNRKQGKFFAF
jgi:hypothetical protein